MTQETPVTGDGEMNRQRQSEDDTWPIAGDQIGLLLRLAGRREAVPKERQERVKLAIRELWYDEVRRRSRRRRAYWAAGALAVAAALAVSAGLDQWRRWTATAPAAAAGGPVATVEMASGTAAVTAGQRLRRGDELATGDAGRMALRLASGPSVRLDAATRLRLLSASALEVEVGTVYVDSGAEPSAAGPAIEIRTPFGVARDVGTQFEVQVAGESLRLRVRRGRVLLDRAGARHPAAAGVELVVDAGGGVTRRPVAVFGAEWAWVVRAAPAFDLEGRTLAEILAWTARETGWKVRLDEQEAAAKLPEVFHGSLPGLRPDQAPDLVLPTFGLMGRLDGGTLSIEPFAAPAR